MLSDCGARHRQSAKNSRKTAERGWDQFRRYDVVVQERGQTRTDFLKQMCLPHDTPADDDPRRREHVIKIGYGKREIVGFDLPDGVAGRNALARLTTARCDG